MPRPVRRDPTWVAYVEALGREPRNLPSDHPDLWQWLYKGTKAERYELLEKLMDLEPAQQDELFDA